MLEILEEETIKARNYQGRGEYPVSEMGLDLDEIKKDFEPFLEGYSWKVGIRQPLPRGNSKGY
jgi:hypothetical protein